MKNLVARCGKLLLRLLHAPKARVAALGFSFLCLTMYVHAQEKPLITTDDLMKNEYHILYGQVLDNVTRLPLVDVKTQLLTTDSTLVFEWTINKNMGVSSLRPVYFVALPKAGEYILRMSKDGYETLTLPYKIDRLRKSEKAILHAPVVMKHAPREVKLGDAVVKATKVKFYVRGDTVVYNADAFQLEEGSMLDALISQLPGAELKDDGRIFVNGRQVESLLLNGEDFFRKDRSVMLENLPTYMVKDIRVYDKMSRLGELMGKNVGDEMLVMDVKLKKDYQTGWMANMEGGGGTDERYLARLFALRYTTHSRLSAFANINNLNDRQRPGQGSEWMPAIEDGIRTMQNGGMDYLVNDRMQRFKLEGEAVVNHTDTRTQELTARQSFLQSGDAYGRMRHADRAHDLYFSTSHDWTFNSRRTNIALSPNLHFSSNSNSSLSLSVQSVSDNLTDACLDTLFSPDVSPARLAGIINRVSAKSKRDGYYLSAGMTAKASIKVPHTNDNLLLEARANYIDTQHDNFAHKLYDYPQDGTLADRRNEYGKEEYRSYSATAKASYYYWGIGRNWLISPSYEYTTDCSRQKDGLHRLDYLTNDANDWPELGVLPSVTDWLNLTFYPEHSKYATQENDYHVVALNIYKNEYKSNTWSFNLHLPLSIDRNRLDYERPALTDTTITKRYVLFRPTLWVSKKWRNRDEDGRLLSYHELKASYRVAMTPPSTDYFVDVRTNDNPLEVYTGNNALHTTHSHHWELNYAWNSPEKQRMVSSNVSYLLSRNDVTMGYTYDRHTGIYTYRPENVDGNNVLSGKVICSTPLDKRKRLKLELNTDATYRHSVDLSSDTPEQAPRRSTVSTTYLTQGLRIHYAISSVRLGGKASLTYTHQTSPRACFVSTDAASYQYGINCTADMPAGWQISTDATMYSRRGYADESMNTDNFVWNIRVGKKFLKGRLSVMLDGFDILNNISNVRQTLNAQGRTETWYMSVPRYALLHIAYKFSKAPKKKL